MHRTLALLAASLAMLSASARGDSVTVDFSSLAPFTMAPYMGGLFSGTFAMTPFELDADNVYIVGPNQAGYAGSIGVLPVYSPFFGINGVALENGGNTGPGPANPVYVTSISATFAPDTSDVLDWFVAIGAPSNSHTTWDTSISGIKTETFDLGGAMPIQEFQSVAAFGAAGSDNGAQILSITVNYKPIPVSVPEPASVVLAGLGLIAVVGLTRRSRR
jgi:PEP-CTERM motif